MATRARKIDKVLKLRTHQERTAHLELVQVQERREEEQNMLTELLQQEETAFDGEGESFRTQASAIQMNRSFLRNLSEQIQEQQEKIGEIESEETIKRERLMERSQAKKILEKVKEKLVFEEQKENERKEQRLIDVLAQRIRFGV